MKILQIDLKQINSLFNNELLDNLTARNGIGKNTDNSWILSTDRITTLPIVNHFLAAARNKQYHIVMINKKAPN